MHFPFTQISLLSLLIVIVLFPYFAVIQLFDVVSHAAYAAGDNEAITSPVISNLETFFNSIISLLLF